MYHSVVYKEWFGELVKARMGGGTAKEKKERLEKVKQRAEDEENGVDKATYCKLERWSKCFSGELEGWPEWYKTHKELVSKYPNPLIDARISDEEE